MKKLEAHESLKHVPMMPSHEIDALARDMEEHGQRVPIMLLNGKIIDGRNRYEALRRINKEPWVVEIAGDVNPMSYISSLNFLRKHWTTGERAHFAALLSLESVRGQPSKDESNGPNGPITQTEAAKSLNVSPRSVKRARAKIKGKPKPEPKDRGTPEEPKDEAGKLVPKPARAYWDRRDEAKEVMSALRLAKRVVNALDINDVMWVEVNLNGVLADLAAAINRFGSALPAYVCPYCKGVKVEGCKACKGRGVMSKFMYTHAVPEEMKRESK